MKLAFLIQSSQVLRVPAGGETPKTFESSRRDLLHSTLRLDTLKNPNVGFLSNNERKWIKKLDFLQCENPNFGFLSGTIAGL